jgi:NAD(P)-dependent dehydrogenase (short-subunit alcohol dehydrogenase family)
MIVITGASRGIGKFLLESYLSHNESVIGTFLNSSPGQDLAHYQKLDVTDINQVEDFVAKNNEKLNEITLINCAGITYNTFMHKSDSVRWKQVIETNLFGVYNLTRALLPLMRAQQFGRIINFSSVVAVKPTPGVSPYATSKAALWGFARSVAVENAALNININNINMGYSVLGMINQVPEEFLKSIISQIPAGKLCEPADILSTVNYLRATNYITGSSIDLSGGLV